MSALIDSDPPQRNIRCPHYGRCLDAAVDLGLPGWQCAGCRHLLEEDAIDPAEFDGVALLLVAVFHPERYAAIHTQKTA